MKKHLKVIVRLLLAVLILSLNTMPVSAATSVNITVTARPKISGGIANFTIVYISETQLDLSWVLTGDAVNIMIRGKYSEYPADIPNGLTDPSDGYLVYYGNGLSVSDTSMDFDEITGVLYYKAWAQKADGTWYTNSSTGSEESRTLILLAFVILALGLTIGAFVLTTGRAILSFAGAGAWLLLGIYSYTKSTAVWDIYYSLFWLSAGMVIVCSLISVVLREKKEPEEIDEFAEENRELIDDVERSERDKTNYDRLFRNRKKRAKLSKFNRTGKE